MIGHDAHRARYSHATEVGGTDPTHEDMGILLALAVLHLATTSGGFGTGNGRAGAIVAAVLGVVSIVLGERTLARAGRTTSAAPGRPSPREATSHASSAARTRSHG